ncbi:endonuclease III [Candidatus Pacearchaeota archaeon CG10_big_fil_rev_8_21_14_0_10_34_76]|nr:MAG: endonuclease III [Candidatus Pacearchaeota archaeon CG10_big_fil_rev_8_21_14_0_10_34_76]
MYRKRAIKQFSELRKISRKKAKGMRLAAEGWKEDWKLLITTIMSARSRDETTIPVAENLFKKYGSVRNLASASLKDIEDVIKKVNFYRNKAKSVKRCAEVLVEEYSGKVPYDINQLVKLPGVGRKTANVFLSERGGKAIAVDTHVFYISRKLDWSSGKNADKVESDLMELFPKSYWSKLNPVLVRFGKSYMSKKEKDDLLERIKKVK